MIRVLSVTLAAFSLMFASCATKKKACATCDSAAKPAACCGKVAGKCCSSGHKH